MTPSKRLNELLRNTFIKNSLSTQDCFDGVILKITLCDKLYCNTSNGEIWVTVAKFTEQIVNTIICM